MAITLRARYRAVLILVVGTALLAGCSVTTDGTGSASNFVQPLSGVTPDPADAPTQAQLQTVILRDGDLPDTWRAIPGSDDDDGDGGVNGASSIPACQKAQSTVPDQLASSVSEIYTDGQDLALSAVVSYISPADIKILHDYLLNGKYVQCVEGLVRQSVAADPLKPTIKSMTMTLTPATSAQPDLVASAHLTVTLAKGADTVSVYTDGAFVQGPQLTGVVVIEGIGAPPPPALVTKLTTLFATRADIA